VKYVLFVCIRNAGRSQMAQAFFERHASADVRAESAGQEPADAVRAARECLSAECCCELSAPVPV
jgi:arsenate reductase